MFLVSHLNRWCRAAAKPAASKADVVSPLAAVLTCTSAFICLLLLPPLLLPVERCINSLYFCEVDSYTLLALIYVRLHWFLLARPWCLSRHNCRRRQPRSLGVLCFAVLRLRVLLSCHEQCHRLLRQKCKWLHWKQCFRTLYSSTSCSFKECLARMGRETSNSIGVSINKSIESSKAARLLLAFHNEPTLDTESPYLPCTTDYVDAKRHQ